MKRFILEQSKTEIYTSHSGLSLIGLCLNRFTSLGSTLAQSIPLRHGISHFDIVKSFVGLLSIGKSDFDAVEAFRKDPYFKESLGIDHVASSARLRQRLDENAAAMLPLIYQSAVDFVVNAKAPVTPLSTGHVALDIDVFPMDNSKTVKEGVSRTYKGHDGYAPIAGYLGNEGWCLGCELREGKQHCQKEFLYSLERMLDSARCITTLPLLVRLDSGHDALETRVELAVEENTDFILKWNPRKQNLESWLDYAEEHGCWKSPREGKRVATFSLYEEVEHQGKTHRFRKVVRMIERTIDKHGQMLLMPEIDLEGWWTQLDGVKYEDEKIIGLYRDHATSEQFHSEFKTDMDLERLPSGKFATNDLIMSMAALSYNMLRWIGLIGLVGNISPVRHPAKRRRLKTVMQELMYLAARVIRTGRRIKLRFSRHCPAFEAYETVYKLLAAGC